MNLLPGHALDRLRELPAESVQCCVTSPPYWGLRDYGTEPQVWGGEAGCAHEWGEEVKGGEGYQGGGKRKWQHGATREEEPEKWAQGVSQGAFCRHCGAWLGHLGLEPTPELYAAHIVEIFQEVRRVLRKDGTLWLNLGDCYASKPFYDGDTTDPKWKQARNRGRNNGPNRRPLDGLKPKDLVGIPWRVAFALQADGWWLRSDIIEEVEFYCPCGCGHVMEERIWRYSQDREIIWKKPNPMPESVTDRPTRSHEYVFLLSKSERYFYDAAAIAEPAVGTSPHDLTGQGYEAPGQTPQTGNRASWRNSTFDEGKTGEMKATRGGLKKSGNKARKVAGEAENGRLNSHLGSSVPWEGATRNKRDVWTIPVQPFPEAHFATFPPKLAETCIRAGSKPGDTVLDPFLGAGTTGLMAHHLGRGFTGIKLNPAYLEMARRRITGPLFAEADA